MKKTVYISILFGLFALLSFSVFHEEEERQPRFTIMGVGDSITEGGDYFTCYLFPLWEKLFTAGYTFDFIGPRESKCRIGTLKHGGFSGKTVEFLDAKIDSLYRLYPADIVLLHAGHNHFVEEKPVDGMIAAYRSIIRKIQAINPKAYILLAQVIPSGKLPKYAYIPELNRRIAELVGELRDERVLLVDQATGFDWKTCTVTDKVHPNKAGGERMAAVWMEALQRILLPPETAFAPEIIPYKAVAGGDSLTLHLFRPQQVAKGEKRPAIVYFFGGGWQLGTPIQFYRECAHYASKGLVAVSVDYRIGYLHHSTAFDSLADAQDAIRWLRAHADAYGIDPDKIAVAGASAGGHLAASLGTIGSDERVSADYKPNLLVLYYPVVDIGPGGYGSPELQQRYREISPLHNVDGSTPPALFLVGTEDPIVPVRTAEAFRDTMQRHGVDCELHLFEGAGHPIFLYREPLTENASKMQQLTDAFLQKNGFMPAE